ncbi:hypothetical protein [Flagellimonas pacifica]|uniref:Cysteine dioxygenase n=1 Tax=Flagellimonas pacifica TaxID=1247520 RepID=A0A285MDN9_9FLAO|nr:hypothetical protein [Allomuricauda parva]SNY95285.1 hypothetical protein SAMN06265377_0952 [Allomuricauda parva]
MTLEIISKNHDIINLENSRNIHGCFKKTFSTLSRTKVLLENALNDKKTIERISKNLYVHQNGFHKYILYTSKSRKWRIRLHIWDEMQFNNQDIHNHTFNFTSVVVQGGLKNLIFEGDLKNSSPYHLYRYNIDNETNDSQVTSLEETKGLKLKQSIDIKKGDVYYQDASIIHKIEAAEYPTATLVLQESWIRNNSTIYRNHLSNHLISERKHAPADSKIVSKNLMKIIKSLK